MVCTCDHGCSSNNPCGRCSGGTCGCGADCRCGQLTGATARAGGGGSENKCTCGTACDCVRQPLSGDFLCTCTHVDCNTCNTCTNQRSGGGGVTTGGSTFL